MTTETVSTRSVLRVGYIYDTGSIWFEDENGDCFKLPASHLKHLSNLTEGDEVEMRLVLSEREMPWIQCADRLPDEDVLVMTKIDDEKGVRNEQPLRYHDRLWWWGNAENEAYVYYTPTHWKSL